LIHRAWIKLVNATYVCGCLVLGWAALAMLWQWGLQVLQAIATFEVGSDSVLWPYIAGVARDLWSRAPERYSRPDLVIAGIAWVIAVGFWSVLGGYVENAKTALENRSPDSDPPRGEP